MHVVVSDVREAAVSTTVAELEKEFSKVKVIGRVCDVADPTSIDGLLNFVKGEFPSTPIQFVAANAGIILLRSTILTATPRINNTNDQLFFVCPLTYYPVNRTNQST